MADTYVDRAADFALQEHQLLRTEIIALVAEARALERNVIVAIGAIWAFLVLHAPAAGDRWIWWSPTFIVLVGVIRVIALHQAFMQLSMYLQRVESEFLKVGSVQGWETFLASQTRPLVSTFVVFSVFILLVTAGVALYKTLF